MNKLHPSLFQRLKKRIPGGTTSIAILLGIFASLVVSQFPAIIQQVLVEDIVTPLLNALFGVIIAINIPMIFIAVTASICTADNMAVLKELGSKTMKRFAMIGLFVTAVSIVLGVLFFPVVEIGFGGQVISEDLHEIREIFALFLGIIPQNIIEPFTEMKVLQVLFLAILVGYSIAILGEKGSELKNIVLKLKVLIFKMVALVMKVIPLVMFLCLLKIGVTHSLSQILEVWRVLAFNFFAFVIVAGAMLLRLAIKHDVNVLDFLKKIHPAYMISFVTGSGSAAIPKNLEVCHNDLKIDEKLCHFYIPLSHSLCPVTILIGIIGYAFYAVEFSGVQISLFQLFVVAFLSIQFAISAVKENGGIIAMMSLLIAQLGLSMDSLGMIMAANIFLVNISGVIGLIVRDADLLDLSYHLNEQHSEQQPT